MKTSVRLYKRPQLYNPCLIAAWSGMGGVALLAANYLRQKLEAEELGEIEPYSFFSPAQVLIEDYLIQEPEFPESKFYLWAKGHRHDLLIFIGSTQPESGYELALRVLDVADQFGVKRVFTFAAFPMWIHHSREPHVWGTATHKALVEELREYGVMPMREGTIGGLNGLLLGVARQRGLEGFCLLGEMPIYATQIANPKASRAVLQVLTKILGLKVDLGEFRIWAEQMEPEMEKLYQALPEQAKEAIRIYESLVTAPRPAAPELDQEFFDEIERFLEEQRGKGEEQ